MQIPALKDMYMLNYGTIENYIHSIIHAFKSCNLIQRDTLAFVHIYLEYAPLFSMVTWIKGANNVQKAKVQADGVS